MSWEAYAKEYGIVTMTRWKRIKMTEVPLDDERGRS